MRYFPLCALFAVFFLLAVASAEEPEKFLLRYRFKEGETLRWNVVQTIRTSTTVRGKTDNLETVSRSTKIWTVKNLNAEGTAMFEYSVRDVAMSQKLTGQKDVSFNSRSDAPVPPAFKAVAESVGVPLAHIAIGPLGTMVARRPLRPYMLVQEAEENKIAIPLPREPVAIGESWSVPQEPPIELQRPGGTVRKIAAKQRFTLEDVKTGVATIRFETQILTPVEDPEIRILLAKKREKGLLRLDLDAGHTISVERAVDETVSGFNGPGSLHTNLTRTVECRCNFSTCEICNPKQPPEKRDEARQAKK